MIFHSGRSKIVHEAVFSHVRYLLMLRRPKGLETLTF